MKVGITLTVDDIRQAVSDYVQAKVGTTVKPEDWVMDYESDYDSKENEDKLCCYSVECVSGCASAKRMPNISFG